MSLSFEVEMGREGTGGDLKNLVKAPGVVVSFWRAETKSLQEQMRDLHSPVAWHWAG
jgi:hypothetical protein